MIALPDVSLKPTRSMVNEARPAPSCATAVGYGSVKRSETTRQKPVTAKNQFDLIFETPFRWKRNQLTPRISKIHGTLAVSQFQIIVASSSVNESIGCRICSPELRSGTMARVEAI